MKVEYLVGEGPFISTAYLEDEPLSDGSHVGTNKHTDLPVHLRYDGHTWNEVCLREWEMPDPYTDEWVELGERPDCICMGKTER